ncbi:MAG: hypothetical protein JO092_00775, partial [Candidatus Eremiobacteraeota bacterium]|nr:hypothetical protein [Candidatus Eremiobacteraeota bacterium]
MHRFVVLAALLLCATAAAPSHVLTADYLGTPYGSTSVAPSRAAAYLTWAQVSVPNADAVSRTGIKTQYYIDPGLTIANRGDQMYTADESTFAHDCSGNRVTAPYRDLTQNLMAIEQASMRRVFKRWVDRVTSVAHYDALFEDDANPPAEFSRFGTLPCGYSDDAWLRALVRLNEAARIPVIINGLNASKRPLPSGLLKVASSSNTLGLNYESCYSSTTQPRMPGTIWQSMENSELAVTATGKMFECMARNATPAASSNVERMYVYASFLLSYDPGTSVLWEQFETPSRFHVEPESQLVALDPLSPSPREVSGLLTPSGAYARQYRRCYIAGRFAGA